MHYKLNYHQNRCRSGNKPRR